MSSLGGRGIDLVGNRELRGIFGEVVQSAVGSRAGAEGAGAGVVQGGPPPQTRVDLRKVLAQGTCKLGAV